MLRRLLTLRWLLGLLLTAAAVAAMLLLGRWQLHRGESTRSLQNYAYAVEWVLFAGFAAFCFLRLARDAGRPAEPAEPADPLRAGVLVPPPAPVEPDAADDPELAAYNAYLARLHRDGSR